MAGNTADLRQRVQGWRAAERREHALRAAEGPMTPEAALDAVLEIWELFPAAIRTPDVTRDRGVAGARAAWRTLRARLACQTTGTARS